MTRSNRVLNRLILALLGLALLASAAWIAAQVPAVASLLPSATPAIPAPDVAGWWIVAASAVVLAALCLGWALSRGRGAVGDVYDDGELRIATDVVLGIVRRALDDQPDVGGVTGRAYRVRGTRSLLLEVAARPGADLPRLLAAVRGAVGQLDHQLERVLPVALHVTPTSRVIPTRDRRVD